LKEPVAGPEAGKMGVVRPSLATESLIATILGTGGTGDAGAGRVGEFQISAGSENQFRFTADGSAFVNMVTLAAIDGDEDDYDIGSGNTFRISAENNNDAITGIVAPVGGAARRVVLVNVGTNTMRLSLEGAGSADANRILNGTGGNFSVGPNYAVTLEYDNEAVVSPSEQLGRWRIVSAT
jgi:hypothetical protein